MPLTLADLSMLQTKLESVAALWYALGMQLKIDANILCGIPGVAGGEPAHCLAMLLMRWLQTKDYSPTLEILVTAVRSIPDGEKLAKSLLGE